MSESANHPLMLSSLSKINLVFSCTGVNGVIFYPGCQKYIDEMIAPDRQVSQGVYKDMKPISE